MRARAGRSRLVTAVIGLIACVAALVLQAAGWLAGPEFVAMDLLMRLRGSQSVDPRIVICDIDAASIDRYGRWPWSRRIVADLTDRLAAAGARIIAFDVVFSEPSRSDELYDLAAEDEALAASLAQAGNVVLGFFFRPDASPQVRLVRPPAGRLAGAALEQVIGDMEGLPIPRQQAVEANIELMARAAEAQGFFTHERTMGVLRYYNLVVEYEGNYYPALALRAVQRYLDQGPLRLVSAGGVPQLSLAGRPVVTDERLALWVNYRGPGRRMAAVSAVEVLEGTVEPGVLTDRLVFVGASESGIADFSATPFGSEIPGVEIHAIVADNLLNESYIRDTGLQIAFSLGALLLIGAVVSVLVALIRRHLVGSLIAIGLVLLWPAVCLLAFRWAGWHLWVVAPMLAGTVSLVASLRYQVGYVEARARLIKRTFQRYVSEAVVEELLRHPERVKLGGERRVMTVLFSDIRGFTTISESLGSEDVVRMLNGFFTPMTRLVLEEGGTLDKYMGDALMAFFGAPAELPDHAARGCRAALAMRRELGRLNRSWQEQGRLPAGAELGIGIGLNSGEMSVGNMGSEAVFDYTVIGDHVNLGSRIEGLNKLYGTEVLASEFTVQMAADGLLFRELDRVQVKGKKLPVAIYEVVAELPAAAETQAWIDRFAAGLAAYRRREFAAALRIFQELAPQDGPSRLYAERCQRFLEAPPPADWDAVEVLTTK